MTDTTGPVTLVYCDPHGGQGCGREVDLDPATIALSPSTPIPGLGRKFMRCSRCGSHNIETRPELHEGGVIARRTAEQARQRRHDKG